MFTRMNEERKKNKRKIAFHQQCYVVEIMFHVGHDNSEPETVTNEQTHNKQKMCVCCIGHCPAPAIVVFPFGKPQESISHLYSLFHVRP